MNFENEIQQSTQYLTSNEALTLLSEDAYWPKWHSPWWHMLLLHEMGETKVIPEITIQRYVERLNSIPLKIFPLRDEDLPAHVDPYRGTPCHCQLGNVYQLLATWGLDVDQELPWIRPWFLKYQMNDGGLNCDNEAYLVENECPSSMVGTIAVFESMLLHTQRPWTEQESAFIEKGARFLMGRQLKEGSNTQHNASERESAPLWLKTCFPRYYLYDVLRGLSALVKWSKITGQTLPQESIRDVVHHMEKLFPDGQVRNGRLSYEGTRTISRLPSGEWVRDRALASLFPLLSKVSALGEVSPFLSRQWAEVKQDLTINIQ